MKPLRIIIFCVFLYSILNFSLVQAKKTIGDAESMLDRAVALTGVQTEQTLPQVIGYWIKIVLSVVGMVFFAFMIYAGFRWMTAQGKEEAIEKAKKTITGASIGLVLIVASYAITSLVTARLIKGQAGPPGLTGSETPLLDEGPIRCCLDVVQTCGGSLQFSFPELTWRMTTENDCQIRGEDPSDPQDCAYGDGKWSFLYDIEDAEECDAVEDKASVEDGEIKL